MLFVLTPGVDWAYAIASGLKRRGVVPAVSGMVAGHMTATVIVAAGVAALFSGEVPMLVLTVVGAAYLVWLGVSALRHPATAVAEGEVVPVRARLLFAKGIGISLLNPKVFLLFLALLPQFVSPVAPWPVGPQMIALGAVHVANCAVVYFAVGLGAATVLAKRPNAARLVGMISGIVMVVLGVVLVAEKVVAYI